MLVRKENSTHNRILLPALALGLVLSANAFAHPWTWPIAPGSNERTDTGTYSSRMVPAEGQLRLEHQHSASNSSHPGTVAPAKSAMMTASKAEAKPPVANWKAEDGD